MIKSTLGVLSKIVIRWWSIYHLFVVSGVEGMGHLHLRQASYYTGPVIALIDSGLGSSSQLSL